MPSFEDELRMDEEENRREIAYIRERLPQELKTYFSDDDLYYLMDAIVDYYYDSGWNLLLTNWTSTCNR